MSKIPDEVTARMDQMREGINVAEWKVDRPGREYSAKGVRPSPELAAALGEVRSWRAANTDLSSESFRLNVAVAIVDVNGQDIVIVLGNDPAADHSEVKIHHELERRFGRLDSPSNRKKFKVKLIYSEREFCRGQCKDYVNKMFPEAQKYFSVMERGTFGERAEILEKAWMKPPPKPPSGGSGTPSKGIKTAGKKKGNRGDPPRAQRSAKVDPTSRTGVENRGVENRHVEGRGLGAEDTKRDTRTAEPPTRYVVEGPRTSPASKVSYAVDPGGVLEISKGQTAEVEGAALALSEKQFENMKANAWEQAARAVADQEREISFLRKNGDWVRVDANFLVTEAANLVSEHQIVFSFVSITSGLPPFADASVEDVRQYLAKHPPTAKFTEKSGPPESAHHAKGWVYRSQEFALYPPFSHESPAQASRRHQAELALERQKYEHDRARGIVGRCTQAESAETAVFLFQQDVLNSRK